MNHYSREDDYAAYRTSQSTPTGRTTGSEGIRYTRIPGRDYLGYPRMHGRGRMHMGGTPGQVEAEIRQSFVPLAWIPIAMTLKGLMVGQREAGDSLPWFPDWVVYAACRDADPELFFPEVVDPRTGEMKSTCSRRNSRAAKRYCADCPVRMLCLMENIDVPFGIFGGFTDRERWKLAGKTGDPHKEGLLFFTQHFRTMVSQERYG